MAPERITVSVGAGAAPSRGSVSSHELTLSLGPHHPSSHGALQLRLSMEGDRIVSCEPVVGFLHRGVEKLFEARDYRQLLVLANRHDWLSAFSSELGVVLAVERLLGLEVPPRATWARTLLAELNRVLSHLAFLGAAPVGPDGAGAAAEAFGGREAVQAVMEEISGGRMHFMFNRVGGLKEDLPAGWLDRVLDRRRRGRGPPGPHRRPGARRRLPGRGDQGRRRAHTGGRRRVRRQRAGRPSDRARLRPAPRRAVPGLRRAGRTTESCGCQREPRATPGRGSRSCTSRPRCRSRSCAPAPTGCARSSPARSTCGCPRCCDRRRDRRTPGRRTRSASTATTSSRAASRRRGA